MASKLIQFPDKSKRRVIPREIWTGYVQRKQHLAKALKSWQLMSDLLKQQRKTLRKLEAQCAAEETRIRELLLEGAEIEGGGRIET